MGFEIKSIVDQLESEKKISRSRIIEAMKEALIAAVKRTLGENRNIEIDYDDRTGNLEIIEYKDVVKVVKNPHVEISIDEAKKYDPDVEEGDKIGLPLDKKFLGRIGAQVAKNILINRIAQIEADTAYEEFIQKKFQIVTGKVKKQDASGNLLIDLGQTEGFIPPSEQIPREKFRQDEGIKALVIGVEKDPKKNITRVKLSRTHPEFVRRLFEENVSEIAEGKVEIKSIAREPGVRTKIAVYSKDPDIDPVGACVGMKGSRVQNIVQELKGEKIDIIQWSPDPEKFVAKALSPAHITEVVVDVENKRMQVIVPDDQLSLAIGRKGHNVKLARKLTGWQIDVMSESEIEKMKEEAFRIFGSLPGVGQKTAEFIFNSGYRTIEDVAEATVEDLLKIPGMTRKEAEAIIEAAKKISEERKKGKEEEMKKGGEEKSENNLS